MAPERYRSALGIEPQSPRPSGPPALTLDHIQVAAPPDCEAAARAFYGKLLGLTELEKPASLRGDGGVWFGLGDGLQLHVGVAAGDRFTAARKAHPALRASDPETLRGLAERLAAAGRPVAWDTRLPEVLRFFTADAWGNRLELLADGGEGGPAPA